MNDDELLAILRYWSFWNNPLPASTRRDVPLPATLSPRIALTVQGVRRCGKSTFLTQLISHYHLPVERCVLINFEDPALSQSLKSAVLSQIVAIAERRHPVGPIYFFFDEIQVVEGWERWLRSRLERPTRAHFVITGSNGQLLSGEFSSVLTGRQTVVTLFPLTLDEMQLVYPSLTLDEYLLQGGFPEPVFGGHGQALLKQYFDDIVERDIRERVKSRSALPIRQTIQMAYESAGSELSLRRISGALGLSVETVGSYLSAAEAAFLLIPCPFFAYSERKRANRNKKYYPIDTGLRRAVVTRTGEDRGKSLEILVFLELRRRFPAVYYWRDRGEIDFVVERTAGLTPVMVTEENPQERHEKALEDFYENFPQGAEAVFVNKKNLIKVLGGFD